jgi:hypothetical protein
MLLTLLIGLPLLWIVFRSLKKTNANPITAIKNALPAAGLNDQNIKFWIAVSAHETAYANNYQTPWTSPVFVQNNNLFGMRLPGSNTTATGSNLGHAVFPSVEASADDLVLYFDRLKWTQRNFNSISDLVNEMKRKGYFTAPLVDYKTGVEYWYKKMGL